MPLKLDEPTHRCHHHIYLRDYEFIQDLCQRNGMKPSDFVRQALRNYLNHYRARMERAARPVQLDPAELDLPNKDQ